MDTSKVTRVEVIDHYTDPERGGGRVYVFWEKHGKPSVDIRLQDDGRTLKVFIH